MPLKNTIIWILIASALVLSMFFFPMLLEPKHKIYNSDYSAEEIEFGVKNVYPKAQTVKEATQTYFQALQNSDKLTVKLLSSPHFTTIEPKVWESTFDKFWEKYQGENVKYDPEVKTSNEYTCNAILAELKGENKIFCVSEDAQKKTSFWFFEEKFKYYSFVIVD